MKSIEISDNIRKFLDSLKAENESYNDLIEKMIEDEQELRKETIEEIKNAKKGRSYSHQEIKERFNL